VPQLRLIGNGGFYIKMKDRAKSIDRIKLVNENNHFLKHAFKA
jgi:hypothetical protein